MKDFKIIEEGKFREISEIKQGEIRGGAFCLCDARFDLGDENVMIGICICDERYLGSNEGSWECPCDGCSKHGFVA